MTAMMTAIDIEKTTLLKIGDNDNKKKKIWVLKLRSMQRNKKFITFSANYYQMYLLIQRKSLWLSAI